MENQTEKNFYDDNEVLEKTGVSNSNYKFFRKILKKFGIIKSNDKFDDDLVNLLIDIVNDKEKNKKTWENAIMFGIKEKYPNLKDNSNQTENIQTLLTEIQLKYKEIDKLKSEMIKLINDLK